MPAPGGWNEIPSAVWALLGTLLSGLLALGTQHLTAKRAATAQRAAFEHERRVHFLDGSLKAAVEFQRALSTIATDVVELLATEGDDAPRELLDRLKARIADAEAALPMLPMSVAGQAGSVLGLAALSFARWSPGGDELPAHEFNALIVEFASARADFASAIVKWREAQVLA